MESYGKNKNSSEAGVYGLKIRCLYERVGSSPTRGKLLEQEVSDDKILK